MERSAERIARAGLSRVVEPGDPAAPVCPDATAATAAWADLVSGRSERWSTRLDGVDPARDLDRIAALGGRFVIPGDDEWPTQLDVLVHAEHQSRRGGPPYGLWVRGAGDLRAAAERSVGLVGARACTSYGEHVAGELGAGLGEHGVTVVSGGAYGIDAAAHRGALAASGTTIAVLACGVDVSYPKGNTALFARIAEVGLLVGELPPGCSPTRLRFLARNRLIAALTRGVVVVEAAARSGALNTAAWADGCGRPVMAVPGPVTSTTSHGAHVLVRERGAILVTAVADVLEAIAPLGDQLTPFPRGPELATDSLSEDAQRVLDAVPIRVGAPVLSISRTAGVSPATVRAALVELTRGGLVEPSGTGWRLSPIRRAEAGR